MPQPRKAVERPGQTAADEAPAEEGLDRVREAEGPALEPAELSFEASLERLEAVVDRLERGELELEASLAAFEEGVRLSARCSAQLADAEQRIETLTREGGGWVSRPFDSPEESLDAVEAEGEEAS